MTQNARCNNKDISNEFKYKFILVIYMRLKQNIVCF
jgi:hypothetical protein